MTSRWEHSAAPIRYPDPDIVSLDPRFDSIALGHAAIERIAGGCRFTEGPVWFGDTRQLLFSDIPNDRIMRWDEETGAVSVFRRPSHYANGNTRDRQGRLITCEMGSQRLTRTEYDGTITVLADTLRRQAADRPERRGGEVRRLDLVQRQRRRHPRQLPGAQGHAGTAVSRLPHRRQDRRADDRDRATWRGRTASRSRPMSSGFMSSIRRRNRRPRMSTTSSDGTKAVNGRVFFATAGLRGRHPLRHRGQCLVRLLRRRGRGRRRGVRPRRQADRPHPAAGALRQCLLRRREAQPPVHGGEPVGLCAVCRGAGRAGRVRKTDATGGNA